MLTQTIIKQYVLVSSKKKAVEVYTRTQEDRWEMDIYIDNNKKIKIGDCEIDLLDIYRRVKLQKT